MSDLNREHHQHHDPRELTYRDLERLDAEQALSSAADRRPDTRRGRFPKDDRRSSERLAERDDDRQTGPAWLTERERNERWPLG
jgi:hypothetical protein